MWSLSYLTTSALLPCFIRGWKDHATLSKSPLLLPQRPIDNSSARGLRLSFHVRVGVARGFYLSFGNLTIPGLKYQSCLLVFFSCAKREKSWIVNLAYVRNLNSNAQYRFVFIWSHFLLINHVKSLKLIDQNLFSVISDTSKTQYKTLQKFRPILVYNAHDICEKIVCHLYRT